MRIAIVDDDKNFVLKLQEELEKFFRISNRNEILGAV